MTVEEQLRDYRANLDAATDEAAARHANRDAAPVRIRPTRSVLVAVVAVAATVAIAFAAVDASHRRSTPPAGSGLLTTTAPTNPPATTTPTTMARTTAETTVPVVSCNTEFGTSPSASEHPPSSLTVATPPFAEPRLSGYSDSAGRLPTTGPAGWSCKALDATDGGVAVGITPPGAPVRDSCCLGTAVIQPPTDGIFAMSDPACQGCVYGEVCAIVPGVDADFPDFAANGLCGTPPTGQHVTELGNNIFAIDDPPGALGPDAARSILRYTPKMATSDASVIRETCILPASQRAVCDALLNQFLALNSPSGNPPLGGWVSPQLTITPISLGAVRVGMTKSQAQTAAGYSFDGSGDGFVYPTTLPAGYPHDFAGLGGPDEKVVCVGAEIVTTSTPQPQAVSTAEGFELGDTVQQLLALYGSRAHYVAAPPSGMTTNAGYVVTKTDGNLVFAVDPATQRIFEIAGGGSDIDPNSCTG